MSSTDIQKSEPVTFDSDALKIDADHLLHVLSFLFMVYLGQKNIVSICRMDVCLAMLN
jgi:hypothetical protein